MNRLFKLLPLSILTLLFLASSSFAYPVLGSGTNLIEFKNWENANNLATDGSVQVGTVFYGVFRAQAISNSGKVVWNSDDTSTPSSPGYDTLTGYFLTRVTSVTPDPNDKTHGIITFGAAASDPNGVFSAAELASGVVIQWYADSGTPLNLSSVATGVSTATDGTLWASMSVSDGYWWSNAAINPTGLSGLIGTSYFGLDLVGGALSNLGLINDPVEDLFDLSVNMYGQSKIYTNSAEFPRVWRFASDDPAVIATPEPVSLILMGAGLLGIGGLRRRQAKAA